MSSEQAADLRSFVSAVGTRLDGSPLAVMLDIDGTLAPIAPKPEAAAIPAATRDIVAGLVGLANVAVALVSGRSVDDAWRLAPVEGVWVIGNHGFELRAPDGDTSVAEAVQRYQPAISEAVLALGPIQESIPGALVENKRWTLSLHYRLVDPRAVDALVARANEVADSLGLRVTEGKKVIELRPPLRIDKGTASVEFAERAGALREGASAMYAGDDRTDEDAFRELRSRSRQAVTVRIATRDHLTSQSDAEFVLATPEDLRQLLEWVVARRSRERPKG